MDGWKARKACFQRRTVSFREVSTTKKMEGFKDFGSFVIQLQVFQSLVHWPEAVSRIGPEVTGCRRFRLFHLAHLTYLLFLCNQPNQPQSVQKKTYAFLGQAGVFTWVYPNYPLIFQHPSSPICPRCQEPAQNFRVFIETLASCPQFSGIFLESHA